MLSPERHLGGQLTTNTLMFTAPSQFDKPEFARKPLIRCVRTGVHSSNSSLYLQHDDGLGAHEVHSLGGTPTASNGVLALHYS